MQDDSSAGTGCLIGNWQIPPLFSLVIYNNWKKKKNPALILTVNILLMYSRGIHYNDRNHSQFYLVTGNKNTKRKKIRRLVNAPGSENRCTLTEVKGKKDTV